MATLGEPQARERSLSQPDVKPTNQALLKKRYTIGDIGANVVNVLKATKILSGDGTSDNGRKDTISVKSLATRSELTALDKKSVTSDATSSSTFRRRSTFRGLATSLTQMLKLRNFASARIEPKKPTVTYENTYRLRPNNGKHVAVSKIEENAAKVLEEMIADKKYCHRTSGDIAVRASNKIKECVKALNFPRYRIVVQVMISQANDQGIEVASRCIWDPTADNYSCVTYKNDTIIAMALIYGVYLE